MGFLKRDWGDVLHILVGQGIVISAALGTEPSAAWMVAAGNFIFWPIREAMQRDAKGEHFLDWSPTNHREAWPSGILGFVTTGLLT